jgi:Fur family iron response transcriptional regulator
MSQWQLKVQGAGAHAELRLRHESGLCRSWSGDLACRLCHSLGLDTGEHPCPKQRAWLLFLLAHAIEEAKAAEVDWRQRLRDHGLVPTPARAAIAAHLLPRARHVQPAQLEAELLEAGERISLAAIRRTLEEFVEWGLLQRLDVGDGIVFYDTVTAPHAHVYNVDTGELADLRPDQAWITGLPELPRNVRLDAVQLVFRVRQTQVAAPDSM